MSTMLVTWETAYGDQFATRIFTAHYDAFIADIIEFRGKLIESHVEAEQGS